MRRLCESEKVKFVESKEAGKPAALSCCLTYAPQEVEASLRHLISLLGGLDSYVRPSDRVLIKPNLIIPAGVDQPAQTHPAVILAMAKLVREAGASPMVGDSPAWGTIDGCLKALGVDQALREMDIPIAPLNKPVRLSIDGVRVGISRAALEADVIINLPKFKAHQQLGATFAVKNMFGCVSGKEKAVWHFIRGGSQEAFCRMLIGICQKLNPALTVIDGIVAMEGQGPISGRPKPLGFLIGSADPIACEYTCCRLVDMDPDSLPILRTARAMQYGCPDREALRLLGTLSEDAICRDFQFAEQTPLRFTFPRICKSIAKQMILLTKQALRRP